jgi:hypothetical protein
MILSECFCPSQTHVHRASWVAKAAEPRHTCFTQSHDIFSKQLRVAGPQEV